MVFFSTNETLTTQAENILNATWQKFPTLAKNQIALTWIVYDEPVIVNTGGALSPEEFWQYPLQGFSYRGVETIYPASVVKLFYLVAIYEWLQGRMVTESSELNRGIKDMIVDSSNDATSFVVDVLSGTTSGAELSIGPFETWKYQRNIVNRYYQSLGWEELSTINVNQKTWSDGPYGRERMFVGEIYDNRNMLTTNAVARLFHSIIGGVAVSSMASQKMMDLLKRDVDRKTLGENEEENQINGFLGESLPHNSNLWSKAGWTSTVRHDCAYIEIQDKKPYILIVFTEGKENSKNRNIIPFISRQFSEIV
ncbi:serine hydrolase [Geminocystis sp. NIES-3709]|uniref:serine hydrolase n=1 Tax=Geminocystis sp. NIES-3709 TaxID=1617448 RepID=UPI0005FCA6A3|nr:serine hydrolase [Geminocystis sp. NIES-3709]BAQ64623.1 beta-lactamase class A [Geminocystis sp. NIES-3709]